MMLIIEYLNVFSKGIWGNKLKTSTWKQIFLAALLGLIPGCLGAYTAVSLYIHNVIGTAALATAMIATSGDEAFFLFSIIPETAILISILLFLIAIASGFIVNIFIKKDKSIVNYGEEHMEVHTDEVDCFCFNKKDILDNFKHLTALRAILILVLGGSLAAILFVGGNDHEGHIELLSIPEAVHVHPEWIKYTFITVLSISLLMLLTVNDHFLADHIKAHIIKKHLVRILLWTFFTLLLLHFVNQYLDFEKIIGDNIYIVLIIAVLVGIIPESGPHLLFIILFASGSLPFSILLANSIVQDGHGSLPLLAETRKGFIIVKAINISVGLLVGIIGIAAGV
jgi:hypothetical protein